MKTLMLLASLLSSTNFATEVFGIGNLIHPLTQEQLNLKTPSPLKSKHQTPFARAADVSLIEQRLDHFNEQDTRTWQQRMFSFDELYMPGGPILVYPLGFDSGYIDDPETLTIDHLLLYEIANRTNGIIYLIENRYLGKSRPTEDLSIENLQYFTVEQSMEDYAYAISTIKESLEVNGSDKVLLFGFSTSGMMATWMRIKYPQLVDGVWASSAPLDVVMNFSSYFELVGKKLMLYWPPCYDRIKSAFQQMDDMIVSGNTTVLEELLNLYTPIDVDDPQDVGVFFSTFAELLAFSQERGSRGLMDFGCSLITNPAIEDDVAAFALYINTLFGPNPLHVSYWEMVEMYRNTSWESYAGTYGARPLSYYYCTQTSWFKTSDDTGINPFGNRFSLDVFVKSCQDIFDDSITLESIENNNLYFNEQFGGTNPDVNYVYFTNGLFDPFNSVGITYDLNDFSPADYMEDHGKGADTNRISDYDTDEVLAVKYRVLELADSILGTDPEN